MNCSETVVKTNDGPIRPSHFTVWHLQQSSSVQFCHTRSGCKDNTWEALSAARSLSQLQRYWFQGSHVHADSTEWYDTVLQEHPGPPAQEVLMCSINTYFMRHGIWGVWNAESVMPGVGCVYWGTHSAVMRDMSAGHNLPLKCSSNQGPKHFHGHS